MEKLIVANLKMNMTIKEVSEYLKIINKIENKKIVFCPTSIYIPYFLKQGYSVGIQNVFFKSEGAYTGEVSPMQAHEMGIKYVILGHSERRLYFDEKDIMINKKINESLKYRLKVILCIGETLTEYKMKKTTRILKKQITNCLSNIDIELMKNVTIAYEPVWAIGSNMIPTNQYIEETIDYIKSIIKSIYKDYDINVLYGGSVNDKNIKVLNKIQNLNGYLIGGSSLDAKQLISIIEVANNE